MMSKLLGLTHTSSDGYLALSYIKGNVVDYQGIIRRLAYLRNGNCVRVCDFVNVDGYYTLNREVIAKQSECDKTDFCYL